MSYLEDQIAAAKAKEQAAKVKAAAKRRADIAKAREKAKKRETEIAVRIVALLRELDPDGYADVRARVEHHLEDERHQAKTKRVSSNSTTPGPAVERVETPVDVHAPGEHSSAGGERDDAHAMF